MTSALDTVVGAAVLDLLAELRRALGMAMVFISHDLGTVRSIADEVMVMYAGRAIQVGPGAMLGAGPLHPYTALLAASVPELRTGWLDGLPPQPRRPARAAMLRTGKQLRVLPPLRRARAGHLRHGADPASMSTWRRAPHTLHAWTEAELVRGPAWPLAPADELDLRRPPHEPDPRPRPCRRPPTTRCCSRCRSGTCGCATG